MTNKTIDGVSRRPTHHLKINKQPFDDLVSGSKTGEVRNCADRNFEVGDSVELFMTETETGLATESIVRKITHIQRGYGLPDDICVLSYAAPVIERQPVAWGDIEKGCDDNRRIFTQYSVEAEQYDRCCYKLTPLYTAPPEVTALQSEIERLEVLIKQYAKRMCSAETERDTLQATLAQLQAKLAELSGAKNES